MNPLEDRWPMETPVRVVGWGRTGLGVVVGHRSRRVRVQFADGTEPVMIAPQNLRAVAAEPTQERGHA